MIAPLSSFHPDAQPLGRINGFPVYLTTVIVAVLSVFMILCSVAGERLVTALAFVPNLPGSHWQLWRWVTYPLVAGPSIWFVIEMYLLFRFGGELERTFGRPAYTRLLLGLLLLPPALLTVANLIHPATIRPLGGTEFSYICVFLGFCLLYPGVCFFCSLPWLTAKVVAPVILGISMLQYLSGNDFAGLGLLAANCVLTYVVLRRAGLSPRFEGLTEKVREALPKPKPQSRSGGQRASTGGSSRRNNDPKAVYEPKIRPHQDLYPEKKAVRDIDALLEKIGREGLDSLTPAEREALQRASAKLKEE